MTEKSGGFWITSYSMEPGGTCSLQTAPQLPVTAALDSDLELEEVQRDTPEPITPPVQSSTPGPLLTPGAARITEEASHKTTGDQEAVVDELKLWIEEHLLLLKEDVSASEILAQI